MLFDRVKRTIDRYGLLEKGDRLIVGVSAGVDSMVLLHLLNGCREIFDVSLIIAHVNHGFRPEESEREAELVRKECARLRLPFEYGQFNVKEFQNREGLSPQDAARRVRFRFFDDLFQKHYARKIALGHNADDQAETVLLKLLRGSGLAGLKGILPIRDGKVIRPLIEVWREEIETFALKREIPFLSDSSNLKNDYLRNKVRHHLIPLIEEKYQPGFKQILLRTSAILRDENDYCEKGAEEAYRKIVREEKGALSFNFSDYQSLPQGIRWRMIKKTLERTLDWRRGGEEEGGSEAQKVYQHLRRPSPSFLLELSDGFWVQKRYDAVLFGKGEINPFLPFEAELVSPGRTFVEEIGKEVIIEEADRDQLRDYGGPPHTALMDYESLQFPLKVRNFRPGDRFCPLGVRGIQKLKDFFIDHKVPRFERSRIPLLISGDRIVWIVGYRIDDRVKILERTKKVLRIEVC